MEGLLPPFVEPTGPWCDDTVVVGDFARGERAGHSEWFHAEGPTLLAGRDVTAALRIAAGIVLVRRDVPDGFDAARRMIEDALEDIGLRLLDPDTLLRVPVGIQLAGLRLSTWDLWIDDLEQAFAALRQAAAGDDCFLP